MMKNIKNFVIIATVLCISQGLLSSDHKTRFPAINNAQINNNDDDMYDMTAQAQNNADATNQERFGKSQKYMYPQDQPFSSFKTAKNIFEYNYYAAQHCSVDLNRPDLAQMYYQMCLLPFLEDINVVKKFPIWDQTKFMRQVIHQKVSPLIENAEHCHGLITSKFLGACNDALNKEIRNLIQDPDCARQVRKALGELSLLYRGRYKHDQPIHDKRLAKKYSTLEREPLVSAYTQSLPPMRRIKLPAL